MYSEQKTHLRLGFKLPKTKYDQYGKSTSVTSNLKLFEKHTLFQVKSSLVAKPKKEKENGYVRYLYFLLIISDQFKQIHSCLVK